MFNQGKRSCRTPHLLAGVVVCLFSGIGHIPSTYAANATPVSCSSDSHFASSCTQCFVSDPLYLGNADVNFRDQWQASLTGSGEEIYLNENTGSVSIEYGYTDGALTSNLVPGIGPWFHFAYGAGESGSDGVISNGEVYADPDYGNYFKFPANSFGDIIRSDAGGFIKFNTKTASIIANKRSKPLYQLKYTLNYWDVNTYDRMRTHQECIISYPAFCGDGVRDTSRGESCDDGDANGQSGKCNTTCTGTMPTDGACGVANNRPTYELTTVSGELCTSGSSANVALSGSLYSWSCLGANSGTTTYCSAPKKSDGVCGTDNGKTLGSTPTNLCTLGTPSSVSGSGPWTWSCMGTNSGVTTSCSANKTIVPPPATCSQFFTGALRVGRSYSFPDYYSNGNSYAHTLTSFDVNFLESSDMNRDGLINRYNSFIWSPTLNPSRIINAGQSDIQIIKADPNYLLQDAPTAGRRSDNIQIQYTINGTSVGGDISHKECIDYAVTWCGDGVLDTTYGEQCDPNDPSRSGWGSAGCNPTSCLPINTPSGFDLSLKKYVDTVAPANDADTEATAINKTSNTNFSYQVVVRNEGTGAVSGVTTVNDVLPANILFASASGAVSGAGWSCNQSTNSFSCTRSDSTASGTAFAPISVSVRTSATVSAGTVIRNDATVSNPNETNVISNTNPAYIRVTGDVVGSGVLSIKKYANTIATGDSQNESSAVGVSRGTEFNYLYRVTVSSGSVSGAIVRDALPEYVEFVRFGSTPAGWSTGATTTTHSGHTHSVVMHQTDNLLASGSSYDFTIVARLRADAVGQYHQNIAYVCAKKILSGGSLIDNPDCTTTIPPLPPDTGCPARAADTQSDPACIRANDGFDLVVRKYINDNDAESAIDLANGATFNYRIVVTNNGPAAINGTTFVSDTFPAGVERTSAAITTNGWNCSASSGSILSCYLNGQPSVGINVLPEIIVPMRVTAGANTTVTNTACVTNDNEIDGRRINQDANNCNIAVLRVPGGGGGDSLRCIELTKTSPTEVTCRGNQYARSYGLDINGDGTIDRVGSMTTNIATINIGNGVGTYSPKCIVSNYPAFPINAGEKYSDRWPYYASSLDTNDDSCKISITNTCNDPNGCTTGGGGCTKPLGCGGGGGSFCGDGVVQIDKREECDAGYGGHIPFCNASCKFDTTTQPSSYDLPFTTIIPAGQSGEYNLGRGKKLSYIGGTNQTFEPFRVIVGQNTPVFRKDDIIRLRSPGYVFVPGADATLPVNFSLVAKTDGPIGTAGSSNNISWNIDNVTCIGNYGDYTSLPQDSSNSVSYIDTDGVRKWKPCSPLQKTITPSQAQGIISTGSLSSIENFLETNNATSSNNFVPVPPYNFYSTLSRGGTEYLRDPIQVRVTRPIIANNAGGAGYFANPNQTVDIDTVAKDFLEQLKAANFNTGNAKNTNTSNSNFDLKNITGAHQPGLFFGLPTGTSMVRAENKDVTLNTVIIPQKVTYVINGKLTINGNITAGNNSIAFIADEIEIGPGVTQLDGVYIANHIKGQPSGSQLIINGSLYGDASELIKARTYARGSSASSGIVTGILVNYSSRVLSDPPPLVSDFLKQYNLTKVTSVQ